MPYSVGAVLQELIVQVAVAGLLVAVITGILGLILALRVQSGILYTIRLLIFVGMAVLGAEVYTFAFGAAFVCFDVCPGDIPSALLRVLYQLIGPGIALCVVGWLLLVGLAVRLRLWARALIVGCALPLAVAGALLFFGARTGGQLLPTTEHGISSWSEAIIGAIPILLCWPLATLLASLRMHATTLPPPDVHQAIHSLRFVPLVALLALALDLTVGKALRYGALNYVMFLLRLSPLFILAIFQVGAAYLVFLSGFLGRAGMAARSQRAMALLSLGLIAFLILSPLAFAILSTARTHLIPGMSFQVGSPGWLVAQAAWYLPAGALALLSWRALRPEETAAPADVPAGEL